MTTNKGDAVFTFGGKDGDECAEWICDLILNEKTKFDHNPNAKAFVTAIQKGLPLHIQL